MWVKGAAVDANTKILPDVYFKQGESYKIEFTFVENNQYSWKFTNSEGETLDSGAIAYSGFFGIGIYGFNFEMKLTSVTVKSGETDLGLWAYDGGSNIYTSQVTKSK